MSAKPAVFDSCKYMIPAFSFYSAIGTAQIFLRIITQHSDAVSYPALLENIMRCHCCCEHVIYRGAASRKHSIGLEVRFYFSETHNDLQT